MKLIAELGVNWANVRDVRHMIKMCQSLGINTIKMQMFKTDWVPKEIKRNYIGPKRAKYFYGFAKENDIELFFTCMYPEAIDICNKIGVKYHKVRFYDGKNLILYRKLKKSNQDIFISCQDPKDTIFYNMAQYQKRIKFLYCIPTYPAETGHYLGGLAKNSKLRGVSDHTKDMTLYEFAKGCNTIDYFEMHICDNKKTAYEGKWSKSFEELKEVLN